MIEFFDNTTRLVGLAQIVVWLLWVLQAVVVVGVCSLFHKKTDGGIWMLPPVWAIATAMLTGFVLMPAFVRLIAGVNT